MPLEKPDQGDVALNRPPEAVTAWKPEIRVVTGNSSTKTPPDWFLYGPGVLRAHTVFFFLQASWMWQAVRAPCSAVAVFWGGLWGKQPITHNTISHQAIEVTCVPRMWWFTEMST